MTRIVAAAATGLPKIHSHWSEVGSIFDRSPPRLQSLVPDTALSPAPDCNLVVLGERFEALLRDYIDTQLQWMALARVARAEIKRLGLPNRFDLSTEQQRAQDGICKDIRIRCGCEAANDRMNDLYDGLEPLVGLIREEEVSTLAGLRARALVLLFEAMPASVDEDQLQFDEQGAQEAAASLLLAAAELTGLAPLVRDTERQLAALGPCEDEEGEQ
jgi:hypothetical protein